MLTTNIHKKAGLVLSGAFWMVALLHVYWAPGGGWGLQESIGEGSSIPPTWSIWLVSAAAAVAALGLLGQIGLWGSKIPDMVFRVGTWLLFAGLVSVTILKVSTGRFWEVYLIAPIRGVLAFVVARARQAV